MPTTGQRRFIAEWYTEIGASPAGNVEEEYCKRGQQEAPDLEAALRLANARDLNNEGTVVEEEFDVIWGTVERYTCEGERTFNGA